MNTDNKLPFDPEHCPHAVHQVGDISRFRRTGDPADMDAWLCGFSRRERTLDGCTPTWEHCPRVRLSPRPCPECFADGHWVQLSHDPESGQFYCAVCEAHYPTVIELNLAWADVQIAKHQEEPCTSD